ncbi:hypothetical protein KP509_29G073000 [Ceratopteris richardii]|uniref:Secreted protein n=1 Tax=Ceratopteris richardii TaxID=49495 RepID=A0A8T2R7Z7_CERRI|nr:hypothetical protein KP509_29G073000 [Ceratopteris richardii]
MPRFKPLDFLIWVIVYFLQEVRYVEICSSELPREMVHVLQLQKLICLKDNATAAWFVLLLEEVRH